MELRIARAFRESGAAVEMVSDSNAVAPMRVNEEYLRSELPAPYRREPFEPGDPGGWARTGGHAMPPPSLLARYDACLILLYRVPTPDYLARLRSSSTPIALLLHGIPVEAHPPPNPLVRAYLAGTRRRLAEMVRTLNGHDVRYQVLTGAASQLLLGAGAARDRVHQIPNSVEFGRHRVGPTSDRFTILFAARLDDFQKGLRRLVRVARTVLKSSGPQVRFVVLGDGRLRPWLLTRLRRESRVEIPGFVPEAEKLARFAEAGLALSTSHVETFSVSLLEGLASGVPFVSTPTAGPTSIASGPEDFGAVGTYHPGAIARLARSRIDEWERGPDRYRERRVDRRAAAERQYDVSIQLPRYTELLTAMLPGAEPRTASAGPAPYATP